MAEMGGGSVVNGPAQITICGALGKDTIAALVEVAMNAGAALMVQPRAIAAPVVDAPPLKALPGPRVKRRYTKRATVGTVPLDDRIRRALQRGPISVKELRAATGLSIYKVQRLVQSGAIIATGTTTTRRVSLPGSAKEEP